MSPQQTDQTQITNNERVEIKCSNTKGFAQFLEQLWVSLFVTTYQGQRVMLITENGGQVDILTREFAKPTGIALRGTELAVHCKNQLWYFNGFANFPNPDATGVFPNDLVFIPRMSYVTGDFLCHDMSWESGSLVLVNTLYSCLCHVRGMNSFVPIWSPKFISALKPEDRCHLNGVACDSSGPIYVTALGQTDEPHGWRSNKASGGILIRVSDSEVIARDLSMPHSPRLYRNRLWFLNSGTGELKFVNKDNGSIETVVAMEGFLRGLSFCGDYAFVGLCRAREKRVFGGLPVEDMYQKLLCGIYAVNINTGRVEHKLHFEQGIEEIYDICTYTRAQHPHLVGMKDQTIDRIAIISPGSNL